MALIGKDHPTKKIKKKWVMELMSLKVWYFQKGPLQLQGCNVQHEKPGVPSNPHSHCQNEV